MPFTTDQLATLETAIAQGALRVRYGDREVIYRDLKEMLEIRNRMRKELGLNKSTGKSFAKFSKGM